MEKMGTALWGEIALIGQQDAQELKKRQELARRQQARSDVRSRAPKTF